MKIETAIGKIRDTRERRHCRSLWDAIDHLKEGVDFCINSAGYYRCLACGDYFYVDKMLNDASGDYICKKCAKETK